MATTMGTKATGASGEAGSLGARVLVCVLIVLDVVFGGSVRDASIATAALEVLACLVLLGCVFAPGLRALSPSAWWLLGIVGVGALVCVLQLIPIPHAWWSALPGRAPISEAFSIAGVGAESAPISLDPWGTLAGLLRLLPPIAVFVLIAKVPSSLQGGYFGWTIVLLAVLSAELALAQTLLGFPLLFTLGEEAAGPAGGFFEAADHQATLQLMAIPFAAAMLANLKTRVDFGDAWQAQAIIAATFLLLCVIAVVLTGSVAGYALVVSVSLVSVLLAVAGKANWQLMLVGVVVAVGLSAFAFVALTSPMLDLHGLGIADMGEGPLSRHAISTGAFEMARDVWPVGSGLGTFGTLYASYEEPAAVTARVIAHAHNDYLEIAVELGTVGCLVLLSVIAWWVAATVRVWQMRPTGFARITRASCVAIGIVLVHSLVDFPARTEAISCIAAACLGLMSTIPGKQNGDLADRSQRVVKHRHIEI